MPSLIPEDIKDLSLQLAEANKNKLLDDFNKTQCLVFNPKNSGFSIQLKPVELPKDVCWWFHPDLNSIDPLAECQEERGYTPEEWAKMEAAGNINIVVDASISINDINKALGRDTDGDWEGWKPVPPTQEHFLIAAFDTENFECVLWWAKKKKSKLQCLDLCFMPRKAHKINGLFDSLALFGADTKALGEFAHELLKGIK